MIGCAKIGFSHCQKTVWLKLFGFEMIKNGVAVYLVQKCYNNIVLDMPEYLWEVRNSLSYIKSA